MIALASVNAFSQAGLSKVSAYEQLQVRPAMVQVITPECSEPPHITTFEQLYAPQCLKEEKPELICACFIKESEKNDSLKFFLSDDNSKEKIKKSQKFYETRFMGIYSQVTVEAAAQLSILGLDSATQSEKSKYVGCTPNELSKGVSENVDKYFSGKPKAVRKALRAAQKKFEHCVRKGEDPCKAEGAEYDRLQKEQSAIGDTDKYACDSAMELLEDGEGRGRLKAALISVQKEINTTRLFNKKAAKEQSEFLGYAIEAVDSKNADPSKARELILSMIEQDRIPNPCETIAKHIPGDGHHAFDDPDMKADKKAGKKECESDDLLCTVFENHNKELLRSLGEKFSAPKGNQCVSFAEFKTYRSMPGPALLNEMLSSANAENLLQVPEHANEPIQKAQTEYLRSNPMIAKLALDPTSKSKLTTELKAMATDLKGELDEGKRLARYLKFMKEKVGPMANSTTAMNANAFLCKNLIDSYSAIKVSQDIPDYDNQFATIGNTLAEIDKCKSLEHNKKVKSNLQATLKASPLFTLAQDDKKYDEKLEQKAFEAFNDKNCEGYEKACVGSKTEQCRQDFLAGSSVKKQNGAFQAAGAVPSLSTAAVARIGNQNRAAHQNVGFKQWWQKDVGSKLSKNFIAAAGREDDFRYEKQQDQQRVANTEVPQRYALPPAASSPLTQPTVAGASSSAPVANPSSSKPASKAQDVPAFAQVPAAVAAPKLPEVSLTPQKISKAETLEELIPGYKDRTPEEQEVLLGKIKSISKDTPEKEEIEEKFDLTKEAQKIAEKKENNKIIAPAPAAARSAPADVVGLFPTISAPTLPSAGSAPRLAPKPAPNQSKGSLNQVLSDINDQRQLANGRGPASIPASDMSILVQSSTADLSGLNGNVKPENVLDDLDLKTYLEIKSDADKLAKYIHSQVQKSKLDLSKLKDQDVISVRNPAEGSESYMAFKVTKLKSRGGLAFEYLRDPVVLPPRVSTRDALVREIEHR